MIERNLGNIERLARACLGLLFALWAFTQPSMNGIEWFVIAASLMLMLNGAFSRCYVWYIFDINSCEGKGCSDQKVDCI